MLDWYNDDGAVQNLRRKTAEQKKSAKYRISASHGCKYFILYCMDYRLEGPLDEWLNDIGIHLGADQVSLAGSGKELVAKRSWLYRMVERIAKRFGVLSPRHLLLRQIELSQKLHGSTHAIIIHHTTCGAYGDKGDNAAYELHGYELRKIERMLKAIWPNLTVELVLMVINTQEQNVTFQNVP